MCTYNLLKKKKKKKWNGQGNGIAEIGGEKNSLLFRQCHCHKSIPLFFFFLRNDMCTQFLQYVYNKF